MHTVPLPTVHSRPRLAEAPMRFLDRLALRSGAALLHWVDARERRETDRTARSGESYRIALAAADADRDRAAVRGALTFPPVR